MSALHNDGPVLFFFLFFFLDLGKNKQKTHHNQHNTESIWLLPAQEQQPVENTCGKPLHRVGHPRWPVSNNNPKELGLT
jgi:hypothetical protein